MADAKLRYTAEQINQKLDRIVISEDVNQTLDSIDRSLDGRITAIEEELVSNSSDSNSRLDDMDDRLDKVEKELSLTEGNFLRIENIETELDMDSEGNFWRIANIETELNFHTQVGSENNSRLDVIEDSLADLTDKNVSLSNDIAGLDAELDDLVGNLGTIIETIGIDSSGGSAGENSIMERLATAEYEVEALKTELGYTPNSEPRLERIEDIENTIYELDTAVKSLQPTSDFIYKVRDYGDEISLDLNEHFHKELYLYKVLVTSNVADEVNMLQFVRQTLVSDPDRQGVDYILTNGYVTYYGQTNEKGPQSITFHKEL